MLDKKRFGFSLIELLVVISLMAILMALASVSFTAAQRRGRDAKRRSDVTSVQKGFEQYFAQNGAYAACATMGSIAAGFFPAGLPVDPKNDATYSYTSSCSTTAYCYCARLEIDNAGNSTSGAASTTCAFATSGNTDWFCVTNLQ